MQGIEKVYYALGELAYLVAEADGKVQQPEIDKLHALVVNQVKKHNPSFEYSDIIFHVLNDEKPNLDTIYKLAIKELKEAKYFLTPEVKELIISVLTSIAEAYGKVTLHEKEIIGKVELELRSIN